MSAPPGHEPTLGEIGRQLADLREDVRAWRGEFVRIDVYRVEHERLKDQLSDLRTQIAVADRDKKELRRLVIGASVSALLSLIVTLAVTGLRAAGVG